MSIGMNEYMEMLESFTIEELQALLVSMLISMAITIVFSMVVCFIVAKATKLSLAYTFLGFLGTTGVMMLACRVIAAKNNASPHFIWLGLFGMMGVLITLGITLYQKTQNMAANQTGTTTYESHVSEEQETHGYNLNGEFFSDDRGSICLNCGAAVAAGEKNCPRCGSRV